MSDQNSGEQRGRFEVRATSSDHFAWLRTRLSIERTLLAWVRTGVSLIGFGFTIVQFFDRMESLPGANPARYPNAPRYLGLMLISCGVISLLISIWQYLSGIDYLWSGSFATIAGIKNERGKTPLVAVSIAMILIGAFAFFSVFFRLL